MGDRTYCTSESEDLLNELRQATHLGSAAIARLAFAYSLNKWGANVPESKDCQGTDLHRTSFFGEDENLLRSLVRLIYKDPFEDDDRFFSRRSVCKDHIDNGLRILAEMFEQCGRNPDAFFQKLAAEIPPGPAGRAYGGIPQLDIEVGKDIRKKPVVLEINNTDRHPNPHLAIIGKSGSGKTQILLKMLADIRKQSDFRTHFILFDYKGDIVKENRLFIEETRATTYSPPTERLPISPFVLEEYGEKSVLMSAREKAESFASINAKFGVVQRGNLATAIERGYNERANERLRFPDFREVLTIVEEMHQGRNPDTLTEVLNDLAKFTLFWEHGAQEGPIERLSEQTMVIDLHQLPVLKELVAYLVIERLYKEMTAMPDSRTAAGRREIRMILAIDEAHNYLPHNNLFLQRIVREGRSKGVAVFFVSQSPTDYEQKSFDFKEHLEFSLILQCKVKSASAVQNLIGCNSQSARQVQVSLAHLEPFGVISKALGEDRDYTQFTAIPFFHAYDST